MKTTITLPIYEKHDEIQEFMAACTEFRNACEKFVLTHRDMWPVGQQGELDLAFAALDALDMLDIPDDMALILAKSVTCRSRRADEAGFQYAPDTRIPLTGEVMFWNHEGSMLCLPGLLSDDDGEGAIWVNLNRPADARTHDSDQGYLVATDGGYQLVWCVDVKFSITHETRSSPIQNRWQTTLHCVHASTDFTCPQCGWQSCKDCVVHKYGVSSSGRCNMILTCRSV